MDNLSFAETIANVGINYKETNHTAGLGEWGRGRFGGATIGDVSRGCNRRRSAPALEGFLLGKGDFVVLIGLKELWLGGSTLA